MDTSTHITMGVGLAALSYLDPAVSSNPELANAVLIGAVVGSNAPDFDFVYKLKGNSAYYRNHRGLSHTLPALPLWAIAISSIVWLFFIDISFFHLFAWTMLSVILHVLFDVFNVYGTQAARPWNRKWLALNCIPLFDPFIMIIHIAGFVLWLNGLNPGLTFLTIYIVLFIYLLERYLSMKRTIKFLQSHCRIDGHYTVIPTKSWVNWDFIIKTNSKSYVGTIKNKVVSIKHTFHNEITNHQLVQIARQDKKVRDFLSSTNYAHVLVINQPNGYEVRWFDLRFRSRNHYPFMASVKLNQNLEISTSYMGWVHQPNEVGKKLSI
ncbi:metal-dependent hydrolase [Bacillus salitolerans]|uniref:Metal-dependent hydrolase n=1 Tax=Bacillus salitolerans TaxID=1437434 RepID=A0ABW4LTD5_9BACI